MGRSPQAFLSIPALPSPAPTPARTLGELQPGGPHPAHTRLPRLGWLLPLSQDTAPPTHTKILI